MGLVGEREKQLKMDSGMNKKYSNDLKVIFIGSVFDFYLVPKLCFIFTARSGTSLNWRSQRGIENEMTG